MERPQGEGRGGARQGDYERLADLEYGAIPELEKKLTAARRERHGRR